MVKNQMANKNISEWSYPMTINYRKHWGEWEAIREITQNMMDSSKSFQTKQTEDGLLLSDNGSGIKKRHFLLGVSEKEKGARGKFGEGLKLALIVLKRLGYEIEITSKNLFVVVDTAKMEGEDCLKLTIDSSPNNVTGTQILIRGYTGETYENKFVNENNKEIIYNCKYGQIIKEEEPSLYVRDIFVCSLENAIYSYNLNDIELSEDRNIPSEGSVHDSLGEVYSTMVKKDQELVTNFLFAVQAGNYEKNTDLARPVNKQVWKNAFKIVYGSKAVIKTDSKYEREATWVGAIPVELPFDIAYRLKPIVGTDKEFAQEHQHQLRTKIPYVDLNKQERKTLLILKKITKTISPATHVFAYEMKDPACYNTVYNSVYIRRSELSDLQKSIGHLVHELAHARGADDLTSQMILKIGDVSGEVIYALITGSLKIKKPKLTNEQQGDN